MVAVTTNSSSVVVITGHITRTCNVTVVSKHWPRTVASAIGLRSNPVQMIDSWWWLMGGRASRWLWCWWRVSLIPVSHQQAVIAARLHASSITVRVRQNNTLSCCRDRSMLPVIEYFAKSRRSLKVIRNDILSKACVSQTLLIVCISYRFWDIQRQIMAWPWNLCYGSLDVTENGAVR